MAFSASGSQAPSRRVIELCRVLWRVRLLVSIFAVPLLLLLGQAPTTGVLAAFMFAVATSFFAHRHWQRITGLLAKHPILLSVDTMLSVLILTAGGRAAPFLVFTVVTSAIAGLLYRWAGMLYIVILQMLCLIAAVAADARVGSLADSVDQLAPGLYYPLVGFAGMWMRRLLSDADQSDEARRKAEVTAAAELERGRLARDMHDSLAKTVRGIAFSASALPTWIQRDPERAVQEAGQVVAAAEVASREARDLLGELRSYRHEQPLVEAVRELATGWAERTGVELRLEPADDIDVDVTARYEMLQVLKEALSNVERHSGAAHVTVQLCAERELAKLTITDDGRGFDTDGRDALVTAGHYGLLGMSERANRAGGEIEVTSAAGTGTAVSATAPRHQPAPASVPTNGKKSVRDVTVEAQ